MSIRDKILEDYRAEGFDPKSKLQQFEGEKCYYPCAEKIRFFNADYPSGTIKCEVVMDNNIFATVKATVNCVDGSREAYGKWYHTNNDVFGMNYLATAQTVAISKALTLMGYSADTEDNTDPDGAKNFAPESSAPDDSIPLSPPMDFSGNGLSVDQAMATAMYNAPFSGQTIRQILANNDPEEITALRDQLRMEVDMQTSRATVAETILPLIS
jgi:hypothetical protein